MTYSFKIKIVAVLAFCITAQCINAANPVQRLVNPNATPQAVALKTFLDSIYGKKIISGQAFEKVSEPWLTRIHQASKGKQPAILSLDFMDSTPWRVLNGTNPDATTNMGLDWVKNKGGILEMHWHWDAPKNSNFSTWQAFYTRNTTFDLTYALNNTTSEEYQLLIRDIDIVSERLLRMQREGIALLWRPLHEAEGKWFWWGSKTGNDCIRLYRLMYNRMVNHHGINNLIWVWTSYGTTRENWYPGDDMVDIIAWDYPDYNVNTGSWSQFNQLFGTRNKLFALGEEGKLFNPDLFAQQHWLYFVTWAYMIKDPSEQSGTNTAAWIDRVYNDPRVLTLDDLQRGPKAYIDAQAIVIDADGNGSEPVQFDGSRSFSTDGAIVSYSWKIKDVEVATSVSPTIELSVGVHEIVLTITDSNSATKTARFTVQVKAMSLTLNKPFTVSSTETGFGNLPEHGVDGNPATRWSSVWSDPQWYQVDLGKPYDIEQVIISWETASAMNYSIQQSNDANNWYVIRNLENMKTGARIDTLRNLPGGARYIRMYGTRRTSQWGYSFYEFEAYGRENPNAQPIDTSYSHVDDLVDNTWSVSPSVIRLNEQVKIILNNYADVEISVYDMSGKVITRHTPNHRELNLTINSSFTKGIYFIKMKSQGGKDVKKLTVI